MYYFNMHLMKKYINKSLMKQDIVCILLQLIRILLSVYCVSVGICSKVLIFILFLMISLRMKNNK